MKYTIKDFRKEFPNDDVCLDYILNKKYPDLKGYYRVKERKCYANSKGGQIHPVKGTIFEKSSTPLTLWFYAIFLFSVSKNGVSAKELERQLGVTYKCAWRMAHQIRKLMDQDGDLLIGTVEVDETYFGKKGNHEQKFKNKTALMGMVERQGKVRANTITAREAHIILNQIKENIGLNANIMSDEFSIYKKLSKLGYSSQRVKHGKKTYVRGNVHTNTIEGFWGQLKRGIRGTYTFVSATHLQAYVDGFAFRYNYRHAPVFAELISRV
ncbi:MAG: IS1595 family transposase [Patescibacteria group bacterium]